MTEAIIVFDTTLRDGEQSAGVLFTERDKIEIAERLAAMRVDVVEAGFPAASAAELRAVNAVARQVRGATVCALARCVPGDVDAAIEALAGAENPRVHLFVNASDVQIQHPQRRSQAEVLDLAASMVARARRAVAEVELSPMVATGADRAITERLIATAVTAGATTINIADTLGYALPHHVEELLEHLRASVPELARAVLSFHGHDDLGMATANALAAVRAGARQVEVCVSPRGLRFGNTSLEEVVKAIAVHGESLGVHTRVDASGMAPLSQLVEERSRTAVPAS
ncbi:MAG: hypothetical protein FWD17_11430 [Polyangiaceae bacterium]|nr:hypothetical protein [Polyangiaceae bacterium]